MSRWRSLWRTCWKGVSEWRDGMRENQARGIAKFCLAPWCSPPDFGVRDTWVIVTKKQNLITARAAPAVGGGLQNLIIAALESAAGGEDDKPGASVAQRSSQSIYTFIICDAKARADRSRLAGRFTTYGTCSDTAASNRSVRTSAFGAVGSAAACAGLIRPARVVVQLRTTPRLSTRWLITMETGSAVIDCKLALTSLNAPVAQGIEHPPPKRGAGSSNLPGRTIFRVQVAPR